MARITSHSRAETIIVDVYHLHGGTGRFTVWESGKQNSRLASFVPESRLPFAVTFAERRPRRSETGIKDGFQEMEHEFSFGTFSDWENRTTFSDVPLLREIFHRNDPKRSAPLTFQPGFLQTFCLL